jgi:hypothetical protein
MFPVFISEQYTPIAAAVAGLRPMFPVIAELWLPVSVIPVVDFARITKLPVPTDKRLTGVGPWPPEPAPGPAPGVVVPGTGIPSPPPHPATKATSSNTINHLSGLVIFSNLFICFSLIYLIPKKSVQSTDPLLVVILMCYANIRICIATKQASVQSAPIQNRINRN